MPSADERVQSLQFISLDTLTAAGVTENALTYGANSIVYQVTLTSVGTSVLIRFEGSLDGVNYFNLDPTNADTVLTANGTTGYCVNSCPTNYVRLRLVSFIGGSPSVATKVTAG
jgi:hypothetical protein